jgi:hypothetical protein
MKFYNVDFNLISSCMLINMHVPHYLKKNIEFHFIECKFHSLFNYTSLIDIEIASSFAYYKEQIE